MKKIIKKFYYETLRFIVLHLAYSFNRGGGVLNLLSEKLITFHQHSYGKNPKTGQYWCEREDFFAQNIYDLNVFIREELRRQRKFYQQMPYFEGYLYQGLGVANVLGLRKTEERFLEYGLSKYLQKDMLLYDLGCNSGFLSVYCALRSGCKVKGVDINPFMINIANHCTKAFCLQEQAEFVAQDLKQIFEEWEEKSADMILSLAAHWTNDKQYRVNLEEHLKNCVKLLKWGGILVLETHCVFEVYDECIKDFIQQKQISLLEEKLVDCQRRKLFIIKTSAI